MSPEKAECSVGQHQRTAGALLPSLTTGKRSHAKASFLQDRCNNSHTLINRTAGLERIEARALIWRVGKESSSQNGELDLVESSETDGKYGTESGEQIAIRQWKGAEGQGWYILLNVSFKKTLEKLDKQPTVQGIIDAVCLSGFLMAINSDLDLELTQ